MNLPVILRGADEFMGVPAAPLMSFIRPIASGT
jgi:hypothetical protein